MPNKPQGKPLPAFESSEQEAAFWDSHSVADYWDQLEPVHEGVEVVRKKRLLSVRLAEQDMEALRRVAGRYGLGAGTLARVWILERLRREKAQQL
ncbi:MAG: hypothetical protein IMX01_09055 [Limnochordaceae bacterium]|nr:hypothetical protein [Limnochordaceae bacterium]